MEKLGTTTVMRLVLNSSTQNMRRVLEAANPGKAEAIGEVMTMMVVEFDDGPANSYRSGGAALCAAL